jgi:Reverse transcriptase (RNA-dependent DNA polymerase)/Aspartyl protease
MVQAIATKKVENAKDTSGPIKLWGKFHQFTFKGYVNGLGAEILVDTGANTNVVGHEFFDKLQIHDPRLQITNATIPTTVAYGNLAEEFVNESTFLSFSIDGYIKEIECYVADIGDQVILGTTFIDTIEIFKRDTGEDSRLYFQDKSTGLNHYWTNNHKQSNPKIMVLKMAEFKRYSKLFPSRGGQISINALQNDSQVQQDQTQHKGVEQLLEKYSDRFKPPTGLPPDRPEDMAIDLIAGAPVPKWTGVGKLNVDELAQLKKQLSEMLDRGHIVPSTSPFGASVLFVKKPDGSLRLCVDYRSLNQITIKNRCPIPNVEEMRERFLHAKVFTKMDLREGFYNLRIKPEDSYKTAFRCRFGSFEFRVVPMGLCNSPAAFQAMMNRIFYPFLDKFVVAYLDDILIYSKNEAEHVEHLRRVLDTMAKHSLCVKRSKCFFMQTSIDFCGHTVDGVGVSISKKKAQEMLLKPIIHRHCRCPDLLR